MRWLHIVIPSVNNWDYIGKATSFLDCVLFMLHKKAYFKDLVNPPSKLPNQDWRSEKNAFPVSRDVKTAYKTFTAYKAQRRKAKKSVKLALTYQSQSITEHCAILWKGKKFIFLCRWSPKTVTGWKDAQSWDHAFHNVKKTNWSEFSFYFDISYHYVYFVQCM